MCRHRFFAFLEINVLKEQRAENVGKEDKCTEATHTKLCYDDSVTTNSSERKIAKMNQYDNLKVSLEVERPSKAEEKEKTEDSFFYDPFTCDFDEFGNVVIVEDNEEENEEDEKRKFLKPFDPRGFLLQPSWYNVYYDLKTDNPDLALKYLERLLDFGVLGIEPPRADKDDRLIFNLLDGPMNVINKGYAEYCRKRNAERKKEEEKRTRKLIAEMDKRSKRRGRKYGL